MVSGVLNDGVQDCSDSVQYAYSGSGVGGTTPICDGEPRYGSISCR